jgi:ketosteroid isomerase-like protein
MRSWLAVVAVVLFVAAHQSNSTSAEAERYIRDSESQWAEAVANGDVSVVQRILSDDFIGVDAGDGHFYPKSEAISWIQGHHTEYLFNHLNEVKVRFFADTAVAQGSESWERRTGTPRKGRFVWTDTWILRNGQWQIVAAEDLIAPPSPTKAATAN